MSTVQQTPLADAHVKMGARMVEFAGYLMPVQYSSITAETLAVRSGAGMFDVSHMARLSFEGDRAEEYLEWVTSNDISALPEGGSQYSLLPNAQGGVVDDIIVTRASGGKFKMVVNASNHQKDVAHLEAQNQHGVTIHDHTADTVMIAVQGPKAIEILTPMASDEVSFIMTKTFGSWEGAFAGVPVSATRSGYTGEDGFELVCDAQDGERLWNTLAEAGVIPCGLGSRDTLRVEAGLPLYGHELSDEDSPLEAGLGWVISKTKSFLGSDIINRVREEGPKRKLLGVRLAAKRLPQPEMALILGEDNVGSVSSGVVSPHLEAGIAFGFVKPHVKMGQEGFIDIRGRQEPVVFVNKRFLKKS